MSDDILAELTAIVGQQRVLTGDAVAAVEFPWDTHTECTARAIVEPETTEEVAAIMRCCNDAGQTVVPFGGMTNLVQGCATTPSDLLLSLKLLIRIEDFDPSSCVLPAQPGASPQQVFQSQSGLRNRSLRLKVACGDGTRFTPRSMIVGHRGLAAVSCALRLVPGHQSTHPV